MINLLTFRYSYFPEALQKNPALVSFKGGFNTDESDFDVGEGLCAAALMPPIKVSMAVLDVAVGTSLKVGECYVVAARLQGSDDYLRATDEKVVLEQSAKTSTGEAAGALYKNPSCTGEVTAIEILGGFSSEHLFFKPTVAGGITVTVAGAGDLEVVPLVLKVK